MDNNVDMNHLLTLENREHLTLTGISDVDSFNEEEIIAISPCGELTIKGELLHIEELNLEAGTVSVRAIFGTASSVGKQPSCTCCIRQTASS